MGSLLEEGATVEGTVENLVDGLGALLVLDDGVQGLLHVGDISWKSVTDPSTVVSVGDRLKVKVLRYNADKRRAIFGLKQLSADPWVGVGDRYPLGAEVNAKVSAIEDVEEEDGGSFLAIFGELEVGVSALLLPATGTSWRDATIGDEVRAKVVHVDVEARQITLRRAR
jgi:small subunit ribosomal protein S1